MQFGFAAIIGPLPVDEGRRSIARTVEHMTEDTSAKGMLLLIGALLAAMAGDFDEARGSPHAARRSSTRSAAASASPRSARGRARSTCSPAMRRPRSRRCAARSTQLEPAGQLANLASVAAQLAETLVAAGRYDEAAQVRRDERARGGVRRHPRADRLARRAREGLGRARRGDRAEAVAQEAVDLADDRPIRRSSRPEALEALAAALTAAGREAEAHVGRGRRARALRGEGERRRRRARQGCSMGGTYSVDAGVTAAASSASGVGRISGAIPTKDDAS